MEVVNELFMIIKKVNNNWLLELINI